ncbi:hypothetical protein Hanom_Chr17g01577111 [Helianthus anomalus]
MTKLLNARLLEMYPCSMSSVLLCVGQVKCKNVILSCWNMRVVVVVINSWRRNKTTNLFEGI